MRKDLSVKMEQIYVFTHMEKADYPDHRWGTATDISLPILTQSVDHARTSSAAVAVPQHQAQILQQGPLRQVRT